MTLLLENRRQGLRNYEVCTLHIKKKPSEYLSVNYAYLKSQVFLKNRINTTVSVTTAQLLILGTILTHMSGYPHGGNQKCSRPGCNG